MLDGVGEFVDPMICLVRDVDEKYKDEFYPTTLHHLNRGGLRLLRREYFPWGLKTMAKIRAYFTAKRA